ncbi:MAG: hypothetical protein OEU54_02005 [Gemmatimonadota bacterium]|nr:hypothetical protein [Gemmatimonadota bacterium]
MRSSRRTAGSVVLTGAVARRPGRGGHAWAFLQYVLGFRRLGWDVLWLDSIDQVPTGRHSPEVNEFDRFCALGGIEEHASLLVGASGPGPAAAQTVRGLARQDVIDRVREADLFINVMGYLRDEEILAAATRRVFLDIDPGFGQMWEDLGLARMFVGHDAYATVGERIGASDCLIPTLGLDWIPTPPPVVLDAFVPVPGDGFGWTSICTWRGPFDPIEHRGRQYGLRAHQFRRFVPLPALTGEPFRLALDIDDTDRPDRDRLVGAGWELVDPRASAGDPVAYREFIQGSSGELMVAKGLYVETSSGWFSDRSVCYLAAGRPVVAQDTGWSDRYPGDEGLLRFTSLEEAAAAIAEVQSDPRRHRQAARAVAAEHFDSDRVLARLADRATAVSDVSASCPVEGAA